MAQRFEDKDLSNAELAEFYTLTKDAQKFAVRSTSS